MALRCSAPFVKIVLVGTSVFIIILSFVDTYEIIERSVLKELSFFIFSSHLFCVLYSIFCYFLQQNSIYFCCSIRLVLVPLFDNMSTCTLFRSLPSNISYLFQFLSCTSPFFIFQSLLLSHFVSTSFSFFSFFPCGEPLPLTLLPSIHSFLCTSSSSLRCTTYFATHRLPVLSHLNVKNCTRY